MLRVTCTMVRTASVGTYRGAVRAGLNLTEGSTPSETRLAIVALQQPRTFATSRSRMYSAEAIFSPHHFY